MTYVLGAVCKKHPELNGARLRNDKRLGACVQCNKDRQARYYEANKEAIRVKHREYARENIERNTQRALKWAKEKKEQHYTNNKAWRASNREKSNQYSYKWAKSNPEKAAELAARYRAAKGKATPSWANQSEILKFYKQARQLTKETGMQYHVDHVIPLKGEFVSGLHVESNLQVLLAVENTRKRNRFNTALSA